MLLPFPSSECSISHVFNKTRKEKFRFLSRWQYIFALIDISLLKTTYLRYPTILCSFINAMLHEKSKRKQDSSTWNTKSSFKIFIAKLQTFTAYVKYNPSFSYIFTFCAFDFFFAGRENEILW